MTIKDKDYSNTVIYKICCKDPEIKDCYVGSSIDFNNRKLRHKYNCNDENNGKYNLYVYQFIRNNGGWNNWEIIVIERYNAVDKLDSLNRERFLIEELKANLNKNIPLKTDKEYKKKYREQNKERIKEYNKNYKKLYKEKLKNI